MANSIVELFSRVNTWIEIAPWKDERHKQVFAWMLVGLLFSLHVGLTQWIPYVVSRAEIAQSTQRRFSRWLHNPRIAVLQLYMALLKQALMDFKDPVVYLAIDTTMLWDRYCVIYVSLIYRGRMIPLVWKVLEHNSSSIAFKSYCSLLILLSRHLQNRKVCLLADRGFVHWELMRWVRRTKHWHFRIRSKSNIALYKKEGHRFKRITLHVSPGQVVCYHNIYATKHHAKVYVVVGWQKGAKEPWIILSDELTTSNTLAEYALRFNIEEGFLDQKSNGFRWESSNLRNRHALQRLCFLMAVATLILVCQGSMVVAEGKLRTIDPHWFRGHSYARIGLDWIKHSFAVGLELISRLTLITSIDPKPARATKHQPEQAHWVKSLPCLTLCFDEKNLSG